MDDIEVVEYNRLWPALFQEERLQLSGQLADEELLAIEHFGSTAVPGLAAKPIIDVLIAVPSVPLAKVRFVPKLEALGYVFWPDNPKQDRLFFVKGMPPFGARRTHHVHVAEQSSEMWARLKFRDYLINNPAERDAYGRLKRRLAKQYVEDREAYTEAKGEFISRIMKLATV